MCDEGDDADGDFDADADEELPWGSCVSGW